MSASAFACAALVFLYGHDPSTNAYFPRCLFHALTGLQCPGCGATRALYHLMHGDFFVAMRFNALFVLTSPALAIGTVAEGVATWTGRATTLVRHRWLSCAVAVLVIGWGVIRNF